MASKKSRFSRNNSAKKEIMQKFGSHDKDTGSPEVQIALLSERIKLVSDHLKVNKQDEAARRGLLKLVGDRRKLISYYKVNKTDKKEAEVFLAKMGLK